MENRKAVITLHRSAYILPFIKTPVIPVIPLFQEIPLRCIGKHAGFRRAAARLPICVEFTRIVVQASKAYNSCIASPFPTAFYRGFLLCTAYLKLFVSRK